MADKERTYTLVLPEHKMETVLWAIAVCVAFDQSPRMAAVLDQVPPPTQRPPLRNDPLRHLGHELATMMESQRLIIRKPS